MTVAPGPPNSSEAEASSARNTMNGRTGRQVGQGSLATCHDGSVGSQDTEPSRQVASSEAPRGEGWDLGTLGKVGHGGRLASVLGDQLVSPSHQSPSSRRSAVDSVETPDLHPGHQGVLAVAGADSGGFCAWHQNGTTSHKYLTVLIISARN